MSIKSNNEYNRNRFDNEVKRKRLKSKKSKRHSFNQNLNQSLRSGNYEDFDDYDNFEEMK